MKKLENNFTTPEQSKRLLELGVPAWTADCFHPTDLQQNPIEDATPTIITYQLDTDEIEWDKVSAFPCWSFGRLIEIAKICSKSRYALRGLFLFLEECKVDECMSQVMDYFEICNYQFDFSKLEE